jgi:hypothetical protein
MLGVYFALDNGLPVGGALEFDLSALTKVPAGCNLWPVTTSLDVSSMAKASKIAGALSGGLCTYAVALNANTVYALVLDDSGDTDHEPAGVVGPLAVTSWAGGAKTNGV